MKKKKISLINPPKLTDRQRLQLIANVYAALLNATESFEYAHIGETLAYLCGAIAKQTYIQIHPSSSITGEFYRLCRKLFKGRHRVWGYIEVTKI